MWIEGFSSRLADGSLSLASLQKLIQDCPSDSAREEIETIVNREISLSKLALDRFVKGDYDKVRLDTLPQNELDRKLIEAVVVDNPEQALLLLEKGANANACDEKSGNTVLIEAVKIGNYYIVDALLGQNADVSTVDSLGVTALLIASRCGRGDIVELLLQKNANPNDWAETTGSALTAAALRNYPEVVELLLKYGAYNVVEALDKAEKCGHTKVVYLLTQGIINIIKEAEGRAGSA